MSLKKMQLGNWGNKAQNNTTDTLTYKNKNTKFVDSNISNLPESLGQLGNNLHILTLRKIIH